MPGIRPPDTAGLRPACRWRGTTVAGPRVDSVAKLERVIRRSRQWIGAHREPVVTVGTRQRWYDANGFGPKPMLGSVSVIRWGWVVLAPLIAACSPAQSEQVSRAEFGADWPLMIESGELRCELGVVEFKAPNGTDYAVNEQAIGAGCRGDTIRG